jgi:hypothetical protein
MRNAVCFERKRVRSPTKIICLASSMLSYWVCLQKDDVKGILESGAEALKIVAQLPPTNGESRWSWRGDSADAIGTKMQKEKLGQ